MPKIRYNKATIHEIVLTPAEIQVALANHAKSFLGGLIYNERFSDPVIITSPDGVVTFRFMPENIASRNEFNENDFNCRLKDAKFYLLKQLASELNMTVVEPPKTPARTEEVIPASPSPSPLNVSPQIRLQDPIDNGLSGFPIFGYTGISNVGATQAQAEHVPTPPTTNPAAEVPLREAPRVRPLRDSDDF